ncbi:MAG: DNA replication/repair protein RecF [Rhodospirillaceae bacterium]|nr:DNA replication/repair protein RecF [Rhodospirillales bacterium]
MSPRLAVRRLILTDFRCYSRLRLETDTRPVVLTGPNGAGKTNILEALSFLTPGRGMRRATLAEIARRDAGGAEVAPWAVAAVLDGPVGRVEIGTGREAGSERRTVRIDGQPAKARELAEIASALWLTPAMDRLFIEGAGGRRRFLDRLVFGQDSGHAARSAAYEHAMRERTRLLKNGGADGGWMNALEDAMAREGIAVAEARRTAIARLGVACAEGLGPFPAARLTLTGEVEGWLDQMDAADAAERLRGALRVARARDAAAGAATLGPHRSDLGVRHAAKDLPAGQCSTGEQKAVLVSIVLAQARVRTALSGLAPLMLLDEVVAHLDQTRRAALFDELAGLNAQSWMTGTDEHLFDGFGDRAQFYRVADATVQPGQAGHF